MTVETDPIEQALAPLRAVVVLLSVMLIGGLIAGGVLVASLRANDTKLEETLDAIVQVRSDARVRECVRDNEQFTAALAERRAMWDSFIFRSYEAQGLTPNASQRAQIEPFLADQEQAVRTEWAGRAPRPCDAKSLEEFYERQALR